MSEKRKFTKPDAAELAAIQYPSPTGIQPDWIAERYPDYARDHGMGHELRSVRTAEYGGHTIKITTTYEIEIDGQSTSLHLRVADDGQLHCHTTPYAQYRSAIDVVKTLLDRFPEAMTAAESGNGHPGTLTAQEAHR